MTGRSPSSFAARVWLLATARMAGAAALTAVAETVDYAYDPASRLLSEAATNRAGINYRHI